MPPRVPGQFRITQDMLTRARRQMKGRKLHPCAPEIRKCMSALEAANFHVSHAWKYVKEMDDCLDHFNQQRKTKQKPSTLFYLTKYLDRQKGYKDKHYK